MNTLRPTRILAALALTFVALASTACESEGYTNVLDVEAASSQGQTPKVPAKR